MALSVPDLDCACEDVFPYGHQVAAPTLMSTALNVREGGRGKGSGVNVNGCAPERLTDKAKYQRRIMGEGGGGSGLAPPPFWAKI